MNDYRPTDLVLAAALRAHLPATAGADLRDRIHLATATAPQQRALPSILGPLTDADPIGRRRAVLLAAAVMAAVALAGVIAVGALRQVERPILPTGGMGRLAFVKDSDLYVANPDGSNPVLVAHVDGAALSRPHWSPDGRTVALQTEEPAILVLDVPSGDLRRLAGGRLGSWSPDSQELSYFTTNGDIAAVDVDSATSRTLVTRPEGGGGFDSGWGDPLAWSPDGRWLLDDHASGGFGEPVVLMRIDASTGATTTLHTTSDFYQYDPDWAPDLSYVVFGGNDERRAPDRLWVANVDGSGTFGFPDPGGPRNPDWSPDGERIAYPASPGLKPPGSLMLVRPDGSDAHSIVEKADAIGWSPDGGSLAYVVTDDNDPELRSLHVRTIADGADRVVPLPDGAADFAFAALPSDLQADQPSPSLSALVEASPSEPPSRSRKAQIPSSPTRAGAGSRSVRRKGEFDCYVGVLRFPDRFNVIEPQRAGPPPEAPGEDPGPGTPKPQQADSCELPFAPDGSTFVRASQRDASFDIVRMDGTVLAGPFPAETGPPRWSPGGGWLAMTSCPAEGDCRAVMMRPDGSERRDLPGDHLVVGRSRHGRGRGRTSASWSARVTARTCGRSGPSRGRAAGHPTARPSCSSVMATRGSRSRRDRRCAISPNSRTAGSRKPGGRRTARGSRCSRDRRSGCSRRTGPSASGSVRTRLHGNPSRTWAPAWSPDGEWVALEQEGQVTLFHAGDWRGVRLENAFQPAWSLDGRHLAVVADVNGQYQVDVTNPDGTGRVTVTQAISDPPVAGSGRKRRSRA